MERGPRLLAVFLLGFAIVCAGAMNAFAAIELLVDGRLVTTRPALTLLGTGLGVSQTIVETEFGVYVDDSTFPVITLRYGPRVATVVIDDRRAVIDGERVELQVAPQLQGGVIYLPLHFVAELVGLRVDWDVVSGTLRLERRTAIAEATANPGSVIATPAPVDAALAQVGDTASRPTRTLDLPVAPDFADGPVVLTRPAGIAVPAATDVSSAPVDVSVDVPAPRSEGVDEPGSRTVFEAGPAVLHHVGVRVVNGRVQLDVASDKPVQPQAMFLPNPARLVVDVPEAVLATGWRSLPGDGRVIEQVRASATEEGGVRIVADLTGPTGYTLHPDENGRGFIVQLNHQIRDLAVEAMPAGGLAMHFEATGPVDYSVFVLREPLRVVINLVGATVPGATEMPVDSLLASNVRISQFESDVVRAVLELRETAYAALFGAMLLRPVEGEAQPGPDGRFSLLLNPLSGVAVERQAEPEMDLGRVVNVAVLYESGTEYILIEADTPIDPELRRLREPERLVLDLPGMQLDRSLGLASELVDAGVVHAVRAGQAEPTVSRIVVETGEMTEHHLFTSPDGRRAVLALRRSHLAGRTIVVDPGHGGRDPGAIGYSGTYEKDVTLAIGLLVAGMLEQAGATVVMTRHEDVTVELSQRSSLANAVEADAFVSIHADAIGFGRIASGTSTFYFPEEGASPEASVNRRYAQALQSELLSRLGLNDRGVQQRAFHVVRNTNMPAALVEVGFIDNPNEEKLLLDPDFQARAAAGIVHGLVRFFSEEQQLDVPPARQNWQLAAEQRVSSFLGGGQMPPDAVALVPMALLSAVTESSSHDAGF